MEKGKLIGTGIGPGDPELLTIKAVKAIKDADVIALPDSSSNINRAYGIIKEYIEGKKIIYCPTPMTKDKEILEKSHIQSADMIAEYLDNGKLVVFATLGDPSIYSTYMYIHRILQKRGYNVEMIAGVTSFCASAARLNISLCDKDEPLIIIPATYQDNESMLKLSGNKVLMKSGKNISKVKTEIENLKLTENTYMVENCGMEDERLFYDFSKVDDKSGYFSLIIVKDKR